MGTAGIGRSTVQFEQQKWHCIFLTHILWLHLYPVPRTQVRLQRPAEELEEHLEADLGDGRVVASLAQLVAYEGVCFSISRAAAPTGTRKYIR